MLLTGELPCAKVAVNEQGGIEGLGTGGLPPLDELAQIGADGALACRCQRRVREGGKEGGKYRGHHNPPMYGHGMNVQLIVKVIVAQHNRRVNRLSQT